jgi:PST family polysaccharide transporter
VSAAATARRGTARTLLRGGGFRLFGYGAGVALGVVATALTIRHLGVVDTGRLVTVLALVGIAGGISDAGLGVVGLREYATRQGIERRRFFGNLLGIRPALGVVGIGVALLIGLIAGYDGREIEGIAIAGVWLLLMIVQDTFQTPLANELRQGTITALQLTRSVLTLIVTVLLIELDASFVWFCGVQIPGTLAALAVGVALVRREVPTRPRVRTDEWWRLLKPLVPLAGAVFLGMAYTRLGAVAVSVLSTDLETGYYGAAYRVIDPISAVAPLLIAVALPVLARTAQRSVDELGDRAERLFEIGLVGAVAIAVGIFAGAEFVIDVVAGPGFEPSIDVLRIQCIGLIGTFLVTVLTYVTLSQHRHREMFACSGIALAVFTVASVALVPEHGAIGAATALAMAEAANVLAYWLVLRRHSGFSPSPRRLGAVVLAAAAGVGAPGALGLPPIPAACVGLLAFGVVLVGCGGVPPDLRTLLPARIRRGPLSGGPAGAAEPEGKRLDDGAEEHRRNEQWRDDLVASGHDGRADEVGDRDRDRDPPAQ